MKRFVVGLMVAAMATIGFGSVGAAAASSYWSVGYYTPSGRALSMASTGTAGDAVAVFNFTNQPNTALLVTDNKGQNPSLLGGLTGESVSASATVSGLTSSFNYYGEPSCGGTTANVRYFFETSNAGGFAETNYWWSNPVSAPLTEGPVSLTPVLLDGANWSDFYGHFGNDSAYSAGFNSAVSNVTMIGLSFGGGCGFENGVGTSDGSGTFTLNTFDVS